MNEVLSTTTTVSIAARPSSLCEDWAEARVPAIGPKVLAEFRAEVNRGPDRARAVDRRLLKLLTPGASAPFTGTRGGLASWQKREVDRYLKEHLHRPIALKELARRVSLSASHFCRAFKQSFGTTPHRHIIGLRLELAQRLMLTTRDPLSHIALECGLADQAHLSKLFRRWVGESPNAWRRKNFPGPAHAPRARLSKEDKDVNPRLAA